MDSGISDNRHQDEHNRLLRILNFRLPHLFKKIGLITASLVFLFLIASKFMGDIDLLVKDVLRTLVLLFLLIAALSKDAFEDEYTRHIRFQSFVIAFVCATLYSISIPLIALLMDILIQSVSEDGNISFYEISSFEVMFILLGFQLLFFETLKRFNHAK